MNFDLPISTDEHQQLLSGQIGAIAKLDGKYWNSQVEKGKEFQFEEITAVSRLGRIPMQSRVYFTTKDFPNGRRSVIVFRKKRQ